MSGAFYIARGSLLRPTPLPELISRHATTATMADTLNEPPAPTFVALKPPEPSEKAEAPPESPFNTSRLPDTTAQPFVESPRVERQSPALPYRPRLPRSQLSEIVLHEGPRRHSSRSAIGPWCVPAWWKRIFTGLETDPLDCTTEKSDRGGRWEFRASQRALHVIRLSLVLMIFGGIVAGWIVFDVKVAKHLNTTGSVDAESDSWSSGSVLLINVGFILATTASIFGLYKLIRPLLEEHVPWLRRKPAHAEPSEPPAVEGSALTRLPNYVTAVGGPGAGTGDAEDRYVVGETPPVYGEGHVSGRCETMRDRCSFFPAADIDAPHAIAVGADSQAG